MPFETILYDTQDGVARVTLNRPERLNAMTWLMIEEFLDAIEQCRRDDSARVLVFTGAGRAFSAGDDIVAGMGERRRGGNPGGINNDRGLHHLLVKNLLELPKPVVAALNGRCHGAGFVLSLACDFRVGHTETLVGDIRSGRAIYAGQGVPLLLPRLIGSSRAMDLLMTGRVIDGTEAERIGYLNRLWQPAEYETELASFLSELANGPTLTYAAWKLSVNRSVLNELDAYTDYERQLANLIRTTEDHAEGRASFQQKRPAQYTGR
ncbi:MAG: enoyl-CoA hydratase/isomerase family protein [Chloroflexi bacterium]|nr:enoyl-CoA hydratase/isomerase family protein [Chloroflexota bacterium]